MRHWASFLYILSENCRNNLMEWPARQCLVEKKRHCSIYTMCLVCRPRTLKVEVNPVSDISIKAPPGPESASRGRGDGDWEMVGQGNCGGWRQCSSRW
jgi:hypothetical protein